MHCENNSIDPLNYMLTVSGSSNIQLRMKEIRFIDDGHINLVIA